MSAASDPGRSPRTARLRPRIVTTRAERGGLDSLIAAGGADVAHVPLIAVEPVADREELVDRCRRADWVAVTSRNGAALLDAVLDDVREAPGGAAAPLRLAAVGRQTAAVLERSGRVVSVVPNRQTAADLAAAFPEPGFAGRVVIVQAERTDGDLAVGLRRRGFEVDEVVGYRTVARRPTAAEIRWCSSADVVTFASGSAAAAWAALRVPTPPAVAIGPSTARRAHELGLPIECVAADHSVPGLAEAALAVARRTP